MPTYATGPVTNYYSNVGEFQKLDPYSMFTPANDLQKQAFAAAGNLSSNSGLYDEAANSIRGLLAKNAPTAGLGSLGSASQAIGQGYTAPTLGSAQKASLGGYSLAGLDPASLFEAQKAGAIDLSPDVERVQGQSLLDGFEKYLNPATGQLVDTTLKGFDENAGRVRAQQAAAAARGGAFGGSRYGLAEAETERGLSQDRALAEAGLRSEAFNAASGLAATDAGFRQQAGLANAAAANQRAETRAGLLAANEQFNAGQANAAAAANANARNQFALSRFGAGNDANRFAADAANQGQLFNAGQANQFALSQAGLNADAARFGADAANQASLFNAGQNNQFSLANFDAFNRNQEFNAQQELASRQQQLAGSGLLGDIAGQQSEQERANLAAQLDAGAQQRAIDSSYNTVPLTNLLAQQGLLDPDLLRVLTGQTINTNEKTVQKSSGGLGGLLGTALSLGASFIPGIGGGGGGLGGSYGVGFG